MIQNVKKLVAMHTALDTPIPFKEILLNPVLVKDYYEFVSASDILMIDKTKYNDLDIIQMSYLDFLVNVILTDKTPIENHSDITMGAIATEKLISILTLCVDGLQREQIKVFLYQGHNYLMLDKTTINGNEFDDLVKIIAYQNIYDYDDTYVSPDVQEAIDEYYRVKNKDYVLPELSAKIAAFTSMTGILKKDVKNMTYMEFEEVFHASMDRLEYQIARGAEMTGMVEFKQPIEHWFYKKKKSKYDGVFTNYESFKKKII